MTPENYNGQDITLLLGGILDCNGVLPFRVKSLGLGAPNGGNKDYYVSLET